MRVRQSWSETIAVQADAISTTTSRASVIDLISFEKWVFECEDGRGKRTTWRTARPPGNYLLVEFPDAHVKRMSYGGLRLAKAKVREHSPIIANVGPMRESLTRLWKEVRFLHECSSG